MFLLFPILYSWNFLFFFYLKVQSLSKILLVFGEVFFWRGILPVWTYQVVVWARLYSSFSLTLQILYRFVLFLLIVSNFCVSCFVCFITCHYHVYVGELILRILYNYLQISFVIWVNGFFLLLSLFQKKDAVVKDENDAGLKKALDHKNRLLGYDKNLYV